MPSRIVRDGILESESVNLLSWEAELFYRRLMSVVDDYGRYNAIPLLLRSRCYPLQIDRVVDSHIEEWLKECTEAGLIMLYSVSNKPYLEIIGFNQRTRQKTSKFPAPSDCNTDDRHVSAGCSTLRSIAHEDEGEDEDEIVRGKKKPLPNNWKPNEALRELALEEQVNVKKAVDVFRDWAKSKDHRYVDWDAVFRNALRKWLPERCPLNGGARDATGEKLKRWK